MYISRHGFDSPALGVVHQLGCAAMECQALPCPERQVNTWNSEQQFVWHGIPSPCPLPGPCPCGSYKPRPPRVPSAEGSPRSALLAAPSGSQPIWRTMRPGQSSAPQEWGLSLQSEACGVQLGLRPGVSNAGVTISKPSGSQI